MYRGVLAACLLLPVASAANSELYRYTNAEGNVVIDHRVPPEYVSAG